jgi:hypothetical protein
LFLFALDVRKPSYATDCFHRQRTSVGVIVTFVKVAHMKVLMLDVWAARPLSHTQILEEFYLHKL